MANYWEQARSNHFKVKDLEAFKKFCEDFELQYIHKDEDPTIAGFYILGEYLPTYRWDEETGLNVDVDFIGELSKHIADDWVATIYVIGDEKYRYLTGYAIAVNSKGERRDISLDQIERLAEELGKHVTPCEY